jgi:hypothetical protein
METILSKLQEPETGLIGPQEHYLDLRVNYPANRDHIKTILTQTISADAAKRIDLETGEYSFFAGTMFWGRLDSILPLIEQRYSPAVFEAEKGQIDGTFAHAIERALNLIPEISGKHMYACGPEGVRRLKLSEGSIPEWSDLHPGKKP